MAATTPEPKPSITSYHSSSTSTSTSSPRASISSHRSQSDIAVQTQQSTRSHHSDPQEPAVEGEDNLTRMERETNTKKREYAASISRMMGRQMVKGLNKSKGSEEEDGDKVAAPPTRYSDTH